MERKKSPEEIFNQAKELTDSQEQVAYLDEACAGDEKLRAEVEALLKWDKEAGSFLEVPEADPDATLEASAVPDASGTVIGRYKLLEKIGEGGMAVVYMAEQKRPIRRRVALKIIKLGMDTKQVIARFEAERQALAMMDHPHIARVLDAGTTDTGRPYFVMELVRGLPITEYCDSNHLNTQERLALFISVCQAVQHAHQKGIIHRDIKPSNIMVTLHDGEPVVKVIDFGIAKAVNQQLTEKTIFTRYSQMIGTPEYMSPEQAEMSGLDIDTRTDVFSLGVLLYELLTGSTPFDSDYLLSKGYGEMQRIIREEEPVRPSTKVSTLGDTLTDVAKHRCTSPQLLCKLIRSDLDWIVMKTLEKDRQRRYESVSELASDITRHLNHEPVLAGRPSVLYRIHKFVKRNKGLVASAIAIVCILLLATGVSLWQMLRANRAAQQEKTVSTQLGIEKDRAVKAEVTVRQQRDHAKAQALTTRQRAYAAEMNSAYQALENNSLNRALELLDRHQPESGQEDLRGFEWRYLWQQCRFDDIGSFKDEFGWDAAFSRDGRYLALTGGAKAVIRDPVSWVKIVELPGRAWFVGFSPSADTLVTAGDKINVWDTKTWRKVRAVPECSPPTAFSPDGQWLVTLAKTRDGYRILDTRTWEQRGFCPIEVTRPGLFQNAIAFSTDGKLLFTPGQRKNATFQVWDFSRLEPLGYFESFHRDLVSTAFLPDSKHLLTGDTKGNIEVWDTADGTIVKTLNGHSDWVSAIVPAPDGKTFVTASRDSSLVIWDAATWQPTHLRGHLGSINALAMSPNGKLLVSASAYGVIKYWDASTRHRIKDIEGADIVLGFAEDSRSLIAANQHGAIHWDIVADEIAETVIPSMEKINFELYQPLAVHGAKMIWSMGLPRSELESLELWDLLTGTRVTAWSEFNVGTVTTTALSADGLLIAAGTWLGTIYVYDIATRREIGQFSIVKNRPRDLAFSPNSRYLAAAGSHRRVWIWDVENQHMALELDGPGDLVSAVAFSPNGHLLATANAGHNTASLWEIPSGRPHAVLKGHPSPVLGVAFTPDGKSLAVGCANGQVKLWNLATQQEVAQFSCEGRFASMAFSPDGRNLAVGYRESGKNRIRLWQAPSLEEIDAYRQADGIQADVNELHPANAASTDIPLVRLGQGRKIEHSPDELRDAFEYGGNKMFLKWLCGQEKESLGTDSRVKQVWENIEAGKLNDAWQEIRKLRSVRVQQDADITERIARASKALAGAYCQHGRSVKLKGGAYGEAISNYETAVWVDPHYTRALNDLAWLQATCPEAEFRDETMAVENATRACELTDWKNNHHVGTLAAVYAEIGDFDNAKKWQEEAIGLLTEEDGPRWQAVQESRLRLYRSGKTFLGANPWNASKGQMVAHWDFDHSSSSIVKDSSGNGLDGRCVGDARIVNDPDRGGQVLLLDGDQDWVDCGKHPLFDITSEITIACWIKVHRVDGNWQHVISKGGTAWRLAHGTTGNQICFVCQGVAVSGSDSGRIHGGTNANDGKWHHVVGVYDGARACLYIDGVLDVSSKASGEINTNTWSVWIGANETALNTQEGSGGHAFDGCIDDLRLYDYALTEAAIKTLHDETKPVPNGN